VTTTKPSVRRSSIVRLDTRFGLQGRVFRERRQDLSFQGYTATVLAATLEES
jgi:UDP-galactopyranose mutase